VGATSTRTLRLQASRSSSHDALRLSHLGQAGLYVPEAQFAAIAPRAAPSAMGRAWDTERPPSIEGGRTPEGQVQATARLAGSA
jgi:hypothetical protein